MFCSLGQEEERGYFKVLKSLAGRHEREFMLSALDLPLRASDSDLRRSTKKPKTKSKKKK